MNTTCCKMIQDKNEESSNKISAADSSSTTSSSSSSSTTTIIATTDTTCRNNNNNNNHLCSDNAIGSSNDGVAILRANHDNDPNYNGDSSSNNIDGDKNRDMDITNRRVVGQIKIKKEEIKDSMQQHDNDDNNNDNNNNNNTTYLASNNNNNNLDDNSYADWEVGSWCWLLPTGKDKEDITNTTDRKRKQQQCFKSLLNNYTINEDGNDANYSDPAAAAARNNASIRNDDDIYKDKDDDNEEEPMKKKMRINDDKEEEEEENNEHKTDTAAATTTTSTTTINDSIKDKNNSRDNKDDDGYESWTKGNWCWLLPADCSRELKRSKLDTNTVQLNSSNSSNSNKDDDVDVDDDDKQEGKSGNDSPRQEDISDQDEDDDGVDNANDNDNDGYESWTVGNWCWILPPVPTVNETTNSRVRSSPRRRCSSSSVRRILDDDDEDDDDDSENNSNNERINSNTGKITMSYKRWQNEIWHEMYQRLVAYKKKHGDSTNVPKSYKGDPKLGIWVMNQRASYTNNETSEERINYLDSIDFVWRTFDVVPWDEMFQRLVTYKKKFKSTLVPRKHPYLGRWVNTQRASYNKKELTVKRINLLKSISFVWKTFDVVPWDEMFQRLVTYKKKFKSTLVPRKHPYLGRWVNTQRASYNKKELTVKRINLLESISFVWNPLDEQWMEMYQKLLTYKKQHRSTKVPERYTDDTKLGTWVMRQRQVYNNKHSGLLTKKRLELLNSINFTWSLK